MVPISTFIKGLRHVINILDIFMFAGDKVKRIQRDKEYEKPHYQRDKRNE